MRDPLVIPLSALIAGILIEHLVPFDLAEALVLLISIPLLALPAWWCGLRRAATVCLLAGAVAVGIATSSYHRPGPAPELDAQPGETVLLEGCVVEPTVLAEGKEQFTLDLAEDARVRVTLGLRPDEEPPVLRYGQRVELEARVRKPRVFRNPGAFDYARFLARKHVYWTAWSPVGSKPKVLEGRCGNALEALAFGLRGEALGRIETLYKGDDYATAMLAAILLGESSRMEKVWTENFRRTGTYHALVISGLHITVLAGVLLFLLRVCFVGELPALALTMLAAWLYAAVAGGSAPVVRAAGGFTLYLAARFFYRRTRILNLVAAVAIAFLLFDPEQLFEASFQLSFLSVAAIGALAIPLIDATSAPYAAALRDPSGLRRDPRMDPRAAQFRVELRLLAETAELAARIPAAWLLRIFAAALRAVFWAWDMFAVSLVTQVALALPMVIYFHRISFTGLTANLVVVPLMSAAVPLGFLAVFSGWSWTAWATKVLVDLSERVASWHAQFEASSRVPDPPLWLASALLLLLVVTGILALGKSRWWSAGAAATVAAFAVVVWHPFPARVMPARLEVTAIDVGNGDSLLVAAPDGRRLLMDTGGVPSYGRAKPRLDIGEDVVTPYLLGRGIRRLDAVAISHAEADHAGGLGAVLGNFRPRELWIGRRRTGAAWREIETKANALGVRVVELRSGEEFGWGEVRVQVLSPAADDRSRKANDDCLALRLAYGAHSFLLAGDLEREGEERLLREGRLGRTGVLKVAHHGSRTSTSEAFLDSVRPALALISVGADNPYRHPHGDVLERLAGLPAGVLRTDRLGLLTVRTDGLRYELDAMGWGGGKPGVEPVF